MRRKRCVWGFSVRVMLPERCWPVGARNSRLAKTRASVLHDARYYRTWLLLDIEAAQPSQAPVSPSLRPTKP